MMGFRRAAARPGYFLMDSYQEGRLPFLPGGSYPRTVTSVKTH